MSDLISLPPDAGRIIVESAALLACPLCRADEFARFCRDRDMNIDRERLLRFERLGIFSPVFRVRTSADDSEEVFRIPVQEGNNWFDKGLAWDTTRIPMNHEIPAREDRTHQAYYSIFQIDWLRCVLSEMTRQVCLDLHLEDSSSTEKLSSRHDDWVEEARQIVQTSQSHSYRPSIALLCQYISNRYYSQALGDQRMNRVGGFSWWDQWLIVDAHRWDWEEEARKWDPKSAETLFQLTPQKLKHAYEMLARGQSFIDPLANWYPLVQFASIDKRRKLKGPALQAETLREGALMLRLLYTDLYEEELPPPNEVSTTVIIPMPEREVRKDARRYLEFVVNDYGLNPRPKLVLLVEGDSEERMIKRLFVELFGFPVDRVWIELVNIRGVDNATGGKNDHYSAILRLVDYHHHHQTLVMILLDNENHAAKLKQAAATAKSTYGHRARITRPEYIRVWDRSLEFDNFSDSELACALSELAKESCDFTETEVAACRASATPGAELGRLYERKAKLSLPKLDLTDCLVERMLAEHASGASENRPIVELLLYASELAMKNASPTRQEAWEKNQKSDMLA